MAIDRFTWRLQIQDAPAINPQVSVRSISFGDGYDQVTENGINSRRISYPLSQVEDYATAKAMIEFLLAHVTVPFVLNMPMFGDGLYQVDSTSINCVPASGGGPTGKGKLWHVTATLKESPGFGGIAL